MPKLNDAARSLFPGVSEIIDGTEDVITEAGAVLDKGAALVGALSPLARGALDAIGAFADALDRPDDVKRAAFVRRLTSQRAGKLGAIKRMDAKRDTPARLGRVAELLNEIAGIEEAIAFLRAH